MIHPTEAGIMIHPTGTKGMILTTEIRDMIHPTGTRTMNGDPARKGTDRRNAPTIRTGEKHHKEVLTETAKEVPVNVDRGWENAFNHHKGDPEAIMVTAAGVINRKTEIASLRQVPKN